VKASKNKKLIFEETAVVKVDRWRGRWGGWM